MKFLALLALAAALSARAQEAPPESPQGAPLASEAALLPAEGSSVPGYHGQTYEELVALQRRLVGAEALRERGLTGKGRVVVILDTGIAPGSRAAQHLVAFHDFIGRCTHEEPCDGNSHGTFVADAVHQVAPEADLAVGRVGDTDGHIALKDLVSGLRWALELARHRPVRVVSLSLGLPDKRGQQEQEVHELIAELASGGIHVVVSSGNDGRFFVDVVPGNCSDALTVGSLNHRLTGDPADDIMASYTNSGPTRFGFPSGDVAPCCPIKPEVLAPGVWVAGQIEPGSALYRIADALTRLENARDEAAYARVVLESAGILDRELLLKTRGFKEWRAEKAYILMYSLTVRLLTKDTALASGTSMAVPLIAGSLALVDQECPGNSCEAVRRAAQATARGHRHAIPAKDIRARIGAFDAAALLQDLKEHQR